MPPKINLPAERWVKGQYNQPKDENGQLVKVLAPRDGYRFDDLVDQACQQGWVGNFFPEPNNPKDFPYWGDYPLAEKQRRVFISRFGEVAYCHDIDVENESTIRILQQQIEYQGVPSDRYLTDEEKETANALGIHEDTAILEKIRKRQNYLIVNLNISPHFWITHGSVRLHSLVGLIHCPISLEDTYFDQRSQIYKLKKGGVDLDHMDKDKLNNSVFNLHWTGSEQNQVMVDWSVEEKRSFFQDAEMLSQKDSRRLFERKVL